MNVTSCMKRNVVSVYEKTTVREAALILVKKHIGLLPVIDEDNKLVGIISLEDLLKLEMPDFVSFVIDVDFVHDFGAAEDTRPPAKILNKAIKSLLGPIVTLEEDSSLLRAYALMVQQNLYDMPVVSKDGKLIGITSRADVGVAILSTWTKAE